MKNWIVTIFILLISFGIKAQVSNTGFIDTAGGEHIGKLSIGGYIDMYYGSFSGSTSGSGQLPYLYTSARNNELNINLAFIDLRYTDKSIRARFVPGFGTYMNSNYAAEQGNLANIVEASAGIRLNAKKEIWLDAGIIGSSYTNESPVSKDHLMYSRSFSSENTPYYQSGLKLSIPLNKKIKTAIYGLNGWQQIRDLNNFKSLGTQVEWSINDKNLLNWDTYMGDERSAAKPLDRMRWFTDLYWIGKMGKKWDITSCIFFGIQQRRRENTADSSGPVPSPDNATFAYYQWWNANIIGRYSFNDKSSISARVEWFNDRYNVMQTSLNTDFTAFQCGSTGLCLNRKVMNNMLLRMEYRQFFSNSAIFPKFKGGYTNTTYNLCGSLAIWF